MTSVQKSTSSSYNPWKNTADDPFTKSLPKDTSAQAVQGAVIDLLAQNPELLKNKKVQDQLKAFCNTYHGMEEFTKKSSLTEEDLQEIILTVFGDKKIESSELSAFFGALDKNGNKDSFSEDGAAGKLHGILTGKSRKELEGYKTQEGLNPGYRAYQRLQGSSKPQDAQAPQQKQRAEEPVRAKPSAGPQNAAPSLGSLDSGERLSPEALKRYDTLDAGRNLVASSMTLVDEILKKAGNSKQLETTLAKWKATSSKISPVATFVSAALEARIALEKGEPGKAMGVLYKGMVALTPGNHMWTNTLNAAQSLLKGVCPPGSKMGKNMEATFKVLHLLDPLELGATGIDTAFTIAQGLFEALRGGSKEFFDLEIGKLAERMKSNGFDLPAKLGDKLGDRLFGMNEIHKRSLKSEHPSLVQHRFADKLWDFFQSLKNRL